MSRLNTVEIVHPKVAASGRVSVASLPLWESRGWSVAPSPEDAPDYVAPEPEPQFVESYGELVSTDAPEWTAPATSDQETTVVDDQPEEH